MALMKKKHKSGLKHLASLQENLKSFKPDVQLLYYLFLGYGNMVRHKFEVRNVTNLQDALSNYQKAEELHPLDEAAEFNKKLCEGIIAIKAKDYESALNYIARSTTLFPDNKEGYIYRFLTYISRHISRSDHKSESWKYA